MSRLHLLHAAHIVADASGLLQRLVGAVGRPCSRGSQQLRKGGGRQQQGAADCRCLLRCRRCCHGVCIRSIQTESTRSYS